MTESEKQKTPAKWAMVIGGILIAISLLAVWGLFLEPPPRDYSIHNLLTQPSVSALAGTISVVIGSNIFTIPALILGIYAKRKNNPKGTTVIFISVVLMLIFIIQLFAATPSSANAESPFLATFDACEYSVVFPGPASFSEGHVGGLTSYLVESKEAVNSASFRAEFTPLSNRDHVAENFKFMLENHATQFAVQTPEFKFEENELGLVGSYIGTKMISNYKLKIYTVVFLGQSSMLTCVALEAFEAFPSEPTLRFMDSVKKVR